MSTAVKHMTRPERFEVTPVPHSRIRQLHKQFPPREGELWWPHTGWPLLRRVEARLNCSVLAEAAVTTRAGRHRGVIKILTWLASVPGDTWQARWLASGAENIRGVSLRRDNLTGPISGGMDCRTRGALSDMIATTWLQDC
ncbi:hypothetical protein [Rhodococcus qingshengii]|uniref:hypothetical protein n=1 Tax=Rhodococcus qingshengii TaxID=334542 RepID=UPI00211EAA16|nr:hypothetical protein [Rhodococcus qingshengii]